MPEQDPVVIVDAQGNEHEFPAGFDPKRAGQIVRERTAFKPTTEQKVASAIDVGLGSHPVLGPVYRTVGQQVRDIAFHPIKNLPTLGAVAATVASGGTGWPAILAAGAGGAAGERGRQIVVGDKRAPAQQLRGVLTEGTKQAALETGGQALAGVGRLAAKAAPRIYEAALKPTKAVLKRAPGYSAGGQEAALSNLTRTGLKEGVPVSRVGWEKTLDKIDEVNTAISDTLKARATETVDPVSVAQRANDLKQSFARQVSPQSDLAAIDTTVGNWLSHPSYSTPHPTLPGARVPQPIPITEAQAAKQGTYARLRGKYGELKSAETEAEKALARGLKEEIAAKAPEITDLNLRDSQLISLEAALGDALRRTGNRDVIGLKDVLWAGTHPWALTVSAAERAPVASRIAIGMDRVGPRVADVPYANLFRAAILAALGDEEPNQPPQQE